MFPFDTSQPLVSYLLGYKTDRDLGSEWEEAYVEPLPENNWVQFIYSFESHEYFRSKENSHIFVLLQRWWLKPVLFTSDLITFMHLLSLKRNNLISIRSSWDQTFDGDKKSETSP